MVKPAVAKHSQYKVEKRMKHEACYPGVLSICLWRCKKYKENMLKGYWKGQDSKMTKELIVLAKLFTIKRCFKTIK